MALMGERQQATLASACAACCQPEAAAAAAAAARAATHPLQRGGAREPARAGQHLLRGLHQLLHLGVGQSLDVGQLLQGRVKEAGEAMRACQASEEAASSEAGTGQQ
jgi:hypothetical protein